MKLFRQGMLWLVLVACGVARAMSATASPAGLVEDFVTAWNTHDPAAFANLMATDADWVTASGQRLKGKPQIQAFLAEEHAGWARHTTMKSLSTQVRMVDERTAVVMFEWEISQPAVGGEAPVTSRGNNLFVALKSGHWLIAAGQVARVRPR